MQIEDFYNQSYLPCNSLVMLHRLEGLLKENNESNVRKGIKKDIRRLNADILIDDDPNEISFVKSIGRKGILVKSYRTNTRIDQSEIEKLYKAIKKSSGFFSSIFKK